MRKLSLLLLNVISSIAAVAVSFAFVDTVITSFFPRFNYIVVFDFFDFLLRSTSIYFLFLFIPGFAALPFYFILRKSRLFRDKRVSANTFFASGAIASITILAVLDIPAQTGIYYYDTTSLVLYPVAILLWFVLSVLVLPLLFSVILTKATGKALIAGKIAKYASLTFTLFCLFVIVCLPEITKPSYDFERPNLLVISIDTLRRDHVSYYGYDGIYTENIDGFLGSGTCAINAYTSSSWTNPSFGSYLTGYNPAVCDVDFTRTISPKMDTLTEILSEQGYRTECFNTNYTMIPSLGFDRGFDIYMFPEDIRALLKFRTTRLYRYSIKSRTALKRKLRKLTTDAEYIGGEGADAVMGRGNRPFFIWCHFMDPHHEYWPPASYVPDYPKTPAEIAIKYHRETRVHHENYKEKYKAPVTMLYDGEINIVDEQIGKILSALEKSGHNEDTVVILFSDHGEEFWDHDEWMHGINCYPEVTGMVLGMRDPSLKTQITFTEEYISHIDLMPTLLEALGLPIPEGIQGESFYNCLTATSTNKGPIFCEHMIHADAEYKALWLDDYFYMRDMETGDSALYNIVDDPTAQYDLTSNLPEVNDRMINELDRIIEENLRLRMEFTGNNEIELSEIDKKRLYDLGYIGN